MSQISYIQPGGHTQTVTATTGQSVMRAAMENHIDGIVAECGGNAMCATCHVYVESVDTALLPPLGEDENDMLECTAAERLDSSRLSCQLAAVDGLRIRIPEEQ